MSRPWVDFTVRVAAAFAATVVLAPAVGAVLDATPFHRVATRIFLIALIVAFVVKAGRPSAWRTRAQALGLRGPERLRRFLFGAGTAVALFAGLLAASYWLGGRAAQDDPHRLSLGVHLLRALGTGLAVSFVEELLCRGYLKKTLGGPASAFLYSAAHFFRPLHGSAPAGGYDPLLVLKELPLFFEGWTHPRIALVLLGLFVFGLALNRMRDRTGTLYLGIGVHAGLVFALDLYRRWFEVEADGSGLVYGGSRLYDGLLGLVMLLALWAAARAAPLPRFARS